MRKTRRYITDSIYLVATVVILSVTVVSNFSVIGRQLPIGHVGNLLVAVLLAYATFRHQLVDVKVVIRSGLVYGGLAFVAAVSYLLLLYDERGRRREHRASQSRGYGEQPRVLAGGGCGTPASEAATFVGGQNGVLADGAMVGPTVREQTAQALRNVLAVLGIRGGVPRRTSPASASSRLVQGQDVREGFAAAKSMGKTQRR